jgi:hypothetical protein
LDDSQLVQTPVAHAAQLAKAQQTPCVQMADAHSTADAHAAPFTYLGTHSLPASTKRALSHAVQTPVSQATQLLNWQQTPPMQTPESHSTPAAQLDPLGRVGKHCPTAR